MDNVEKYAYYSLKAYEGLNQGSAQISDRNRDKMRRIAGILYKNGEISSLRPLLYHEHIAVKCDVAIQLLPFYTEEAEAVLEELSKKRGDLTYSTARVTLKEWRKGNIKFPEYEM